MRARFLLMIVRRARPFPARWPDFAIAVALVLMVPMAGWWSYRSNLASGYEELAARTAPQLDLYAAGLDGELRRHEQLAGLVDMNQGLLDLLVAPAKPRGLMEHASSSLARLAATSGTRSILVLDATGRCIAASDWHLPGNWLGEDLSGSELFRKALQSGQAGLFAGGVSSATDSPEYQFAQLIRHAGRVLGAVVVKVNLDKLEAGWIAEGARSRGDRLVVVDDNDVVVLSSLPELKLRVMRPLSLGDRERLRELGRYREQIGMFQPLNAIFEEATARGSLVRMAFRGPGAPMVRYLEQERAIAQPVSRIALLADASGVRVNAIKSAAAAGGAVLLVGVLCLYFLQMRREATSRRSAREMLQRAHDDLGRRVEERTAELSLINKELVREIGERAKTEAVLRTAQEELVQAGKMALLGQLAAGVAHEINQPLMALRALADNARVLLERGQADVAASNLESIAALTQRMGRITAQLKSFARKAPPAAHERADVEQCVRNALALVDNKIRAEHVGVETEVPPIVAECEANRLEQVLVNLLANSLDAMKGQQNPKRVTLRAHVSQGRAVLRVADNGPGVAEDAEHRLFEPFFSTKPQGEGLGLGLAISASIVREFGGTLRLVPSEEGAAFELDLKLSEESAA